MKANTIDQLPEDHNTQPDHFIFQEGTEPSQLSGPVRLKNLSKIEEGVALGVTSEGQIVRLEPGLQKQKDLIERVLSELNRNKALYTKGKWEGYDVGSPQERIVNLYMAGEAFGLRLENLAGLPESSGKNVGRVLLNTIDEKIYCDLGYKLKRVSCEKFEKDIQVSDPKQVIEIDLSDSDIDDARRCLFQICFNANDFERVPAKIKTPDAKKVFIELPLGSEIGTYRVLGME